MLSTFARNRCPFSSEYAFVIKLHALFEAAVTRLLVKRLGEKSLESIFSRLAMSNMWTGKLAFAKSLGVMQRNTSRYIQKLSELRNRFVHDVGKANVEIGDYLSQLDEGPKKGYRTSFCFGHREGQTVRPKRPDGLYDLKKLMTLFTAATFDHIPKLTIWFGAMYCLGRIYSHTELADIHSQKRKLNSQLAELVERLVSEEIDPTNQG